MKTEPVEGRFTKYAKLTDVPLMVLALSMIPLLVIPLVMELPPRIDRVILGVDWAIWGVFAADYVIRVYLSKGRRWRFIATHVPDLIIVLIPFLRPLRILRSARVLRLLRLTRVVAFVTKFIAEVRAILMHRGLNYVLLVVIALVFLGAGLVREFERNVEGASINNYTEALWWAAATITTVGYGDAFPQSAAGRGVAIFLMILGIALLGVMTATIASYFVAEKAHEEAESVEIKLDRISQRLDLIEEQLTKDAVQGPI